MIRNDKMGYYGYLVVSAVFIVYMFVAGFIHSFGVFVDQFDRAFCQPNDCLDVLALVSALALANYRLLCWLVVVLERYVSSPALFITGFLLCLTSMFSTAYVTDLKTLFITHSLLYGFGSTLMLNSPLKVIDSYFPRSHPRHVLTTSIMNLGSPLGVVIMNPLAVYLDEHEAHSWRDTFMILGGTIAIAGIFYLCTLIKPYFLKSHPREYEDLDESNDLQILEPEQNHETSKLKAICNPICLSWITGLYLVSSAIFIPKTLFIQYMTNTQGIAEADAALIMSGSGIAEAACSFIISFIGDYLSFHILIIYIIGSTMLSAGSFLLPFVTSSSQIAFYTIVHGAVDGFLMTVLFSVVDHVTLDDRHRGVVWSVTNFAVGLGQITGLPIAGFLYDKFRTYDIVFQFASGLFLANTIMFFVTYAVRFYQEPFPDPLSLPANEAYDEPFPDEAPRRRTSGESPPPAPNISP